MSETNGAATRNRVGRRIPNLNGNSSESDGGESSQQGSRQQFRAAFRLRLDSKTQRWFIGIGVAVILFAGAGWAVMANSRRVSTQLPH